MARPRSLLSRWPRPVTLLMSHLLLDDASDRLVTLTLLFSAGTFIYVATVDTLPAIHNPNTGRRSVMAVLVGAVLFGAVFVGLDVGGLLDHSH